MSLYDGIHSARRIQHLVDGNCDTHHVGDLSIALAPPMVVAEQHLVVLEALDQHGHLVGDTAQLVMVHH